MVLAEPGGAVAVVLEQAADRGLVALDDAVVAGEAGGLLRDHAKPRRVVVAAGDQGGPSGGAERRGEHAVVTQPGLGHTLHRRRGDHTAEGAGHPESGVVGDDKQHIGRTLRWRDPRCPPRPRLQRGVLDHATEGGRWGRQLVAAERGCGIGGTEGAGDRLGQHGRPARLPTHQQRHQGQGPEAGNETGQQAGGSARPEPVADGAEPGEQGVGVGISHEGGGRC